MQIFYEEWKNSAEAKDKLSKRVIDPEGLLAGKGNISGVYEILFVNEKLNMEVSAYIGQAGDDIVAPTYVARSCYERILQHLKRWLGGKFFTYWTGLEDSDDSDWKIKLHLLCEETVRAKRLELEEKFIEERNPFLQDSVNGMYDFYPVKNGYCRNDLCIHPWKRDGENMGQRRLAFLYRVENLKKVI